MTSKLCIFFPLALLFTACAPAPASSGTYNPMLDPQIKTLSEQGMNTTLQIFSNQGCSAKGYTESFAIGEQLNTISTRYISVMNGYGTYSDAEMDMAKSALLHSAFARINLMKDIANKAESMNCKAIERKAYNNLIADPVFSTRIARLFNQDLMIAQSKLSQLGSR